jgi:rod shape-determining protein MreD
MIYLVGFILFGLLVIVQSTLVSRMPLLQGTPDLILLFILAWSLQDRVKSAWQWCLIGGILASFYSALPFGTYLIAYLLATGVARVLKRRVWKAPFLAMMAATFIGTLIIQLLSIISLLLIETNVLVLTVLNTIVLPGLLLNLILAIPIFYIMQDMARWLYPEELEV